MTDPKALDLANTVFNVLCVLIFAAWLYAIHSDVREVRDAMREMNKSAINRVDK